jgi:putative nucleotidyltransferase with HDIG domain
MTTQTSTAAAAPAQTPASPVAEFIRPAQLAGQINSQPLTTADEAAATALEMALRERAAGLHSSTPLVRRIATAITRALGLDEPAHALVELCAQVRDVGMIGLPDDLVLATGRLSTQDWQLLSAHPARSAQLLEAVHAPIAAVAIVRHHHERWDGQGYPDGLRGTDIPMLSRVIAVADGFVAIARDRPHRRGSGTDAALEQVSRESGSQFDPAILDALTHVVTGSSDPGRTSTAHRDTAATPPAARPEAPKGRPDVGRAIVALQSLPAFPLAHERVIAATRAATPITGDLITAVEADLAIMIAVLSAAAAESKRPVNGVEDAVAVLGPRGVRQAAATVNLAAFPWRTHREALLHQVHAHGLLVSRAARRIARLTSRHDEDTFNTLGLLHDIGKIALAQAGMDYADTLHPRTGAPEERAQRERRDTQFDHASIGGLAVKRAGLPQELADAIHGHHQPGFKNERATLLRLADMIVHYSQGNPVNRTTLLELASACGLSAEGLQEVLLDLPHGGGSQRRRAEPSPLTDRETDVLRLLADGLVYAQIGLELKLAVSTVRSHLHKIYPKLDAVDRAQAVLRASEMGWI